MHTVYLFNLLYWADSIAGMYPGQKKTNNNYKNKVLPRHCDTGVVVLFLALRMNRIAIIRMIKCCLKHRYNERFM